MTFRMRAAPGYGSTKELLSHELGKDVGMKEVLLQQNGASTDRSLSGTVREQAMMVVIEL